MSKGATRLELEREKTHVRDDGGTEDAHEEATDEDRPHVAGDGLEKSGSRGQRRRKEREREMQTHDACREENEGSQRWQ